MTIVHGTYDELFVCSTTKPGMSYGFESNNLQDNCLSSLNVNSVGLIEPCVILHQE